MTFYWMQNGVIVIKDYEEYALSIIPEYNKLFNKLFCLGVNNKLCPIMISNKMKKLSLYFETIFKGLEKAKLASEA